MNSAALQINNLVSIRRPRSFVLILLAAIGVDQQLVDRIHTIKTRGYKTTIILLSSFVCIHIFQSLLLLTRPSGLNILTLGGSVTWGAFADGHRELAYPFRLRDLYGHKVVNLGIRGTGSEYPAQCITTMLAEYEKEKRDFRGNTLFDVIILEFSINGLAGFDLLFERLTERYPDALIIYVDLFTLDTPNGAFDSSEVHKMVEGYGGIVYQFGQLGAPNEDFDFRVEIQDRVHPSEEIQNFFDVDNHHLSALGHDLVVKKVTEIIDQHEFVENPRLGSWVGGDTCVSWYMTGKTFLKVKDHGEMKEWDPKKHKFAIEVHPDGTTFEYFHDSKQEAALNLQYMTKVLEIGNPLTSLYPPVIVAISQNPEEIKEARDIAISSNIPFNRKNITPGLTYLHGLNKRPGLQKHHVTDISNVGVLKPGLNIILIFPVEKRKEPFRLTAIVICEACEALGFEDI